MDFDTKPMKEYNLVVPSEAENVEKVEELTEKVLTHTKFKDEERDSIAIAVTEAVNNAIIHGNKRDPKKSVYVHIKVYEEAIEITVRDEGNGFNPDKVADPLAPENILKESGRGVFILKSLMDEVVFDFASGGTALTMRKRHRK